MGGFAVSVDWEDRPDPATVDTMMSLIPHRSPAGIHTTTHDHAVLAEGRVNSTDPPWTLATLGPLTLVGELRLWNTDSLRSVAGGSTATEGLTERQTVLAAYRRSGWQRTLTALDGDFAFVIWDDENRTVLAARDRFGVVPLFWQRTDTGVRFASEPKQLVTVARQVTPDSASVAAHLATVATPQRHTFFSGIERVLPASAIVGTPTHIAEPAYWSPPTEVDHTVRVEDTPHMFREHLTEAVRRRLATSSIAVGQLSGGLDSTAIAASADILTQRGMDPAGFATVSGVFPGSTADESRWINDVSDAQPFTHHSFPVTIPDLDTYRADMWLTDRPRVAPTRNVTVGSVAYGVAIGADTLLAGHAGDALIHDDHLLSDMLTERSFRQWWRTATATASNNGVPTMSVAIPSLGRAIPERLKARLRGGTTGAEASTGTARFSSRTQAGIAASLHAGVLTEATEFLDAHTASAGITLSAPHLDLSLVEFMLSIPVSARPADGRTKAIVRHAFHGYLPDSVVERTSRSIADDFMVAAFSVLADELTDRYRTSTEAAAPFIDADVYEAAITSEGPPDIGRYRTLWPAWTLMLWLEDLGRYRT